MSVSPQENAEQEQAESRAREARMDRVLRYLPLLTVGQLVIGAPAFIISVVVAYATSVQADATRKMTEASVWPRLQIGRSFDSGVAQRRPDGGFDYDEAKFVTSIIVHNAGIGPAVVKHVRVSVDGVAYRDWFGLVEQAFGINGISNGSLAARVVSAGETVQWLTLDGKAALALRDAYDEGRLQAQVCYCSVFDSCWLLRSEQAEVEPVPACPAADDQAFTM